MLATVISPGQDADCRSQVGQRVPAGLAGPGLDVDNHQVRRSGTEVTVGVAHQAAQQLELAGYLKRTPTVLRTADSFRQAGIA